MSLKYDESEYGASASNPNLCSGSEAGSYLRLIDFVYHSTLGLSVQRREHVRRRRVQPEPVSIR